MISIIIPVFNEAPYLDLLLPFLKENGNGQLTEIIVVDAGSEDDTKNICEKHDVVFISSDVASRAMQMNKGAAAATGKLFYFVHADTRPPVKYAHHLVSSVHAGTHAGRFKTEFDSKSFLLRMNAYFTKFDWFMCYGGDQTLFVDSHLFNTIGGFNEALSIMEDYDITERIKCQGKYAILNDVVKVSARKYQKNSWWQVQRANYKAVKSYKNKVDHSIIKADYVSRIKR